MGGGVRPRTLALDLAQDLGGDRRVEVDGVVPQTLRSLVALPAAALEGLANTDLCAVAVLGVVLDPVYILVSLLAAGDRAGEGLLLPSVHAHGAEDGLRADGTLCGPRLIAVRLLEVYILLVILTACGGAAAERGRGGDGRSDGWSQVPAGVPRGRGCAVPGHAPCDGQGQFGSGLLLHGLLLPAGRVCHKPVDVAKGQVGGLLLLLLLQDPRVCVDVIVLDVDDQLGE